MLSVAVALTAMLPSHPPLEPMIVPRPVALVRNPGAFTLDEKTQLQGPKPIVDLARAYLAPGTGCPLPTAGEVTTLENLITFRLDPQASPSPEGYTLDADETGVRIVAPTESGLFYGLQTLRQLLPPDALRQAQTHQGPWQIPAVSIKDHPRFSWRGLMLDVARHFMPKEDVLKFIDLAAFHKMNVVHLHLTEDQGWRVEIKKYPKLTEIGAWRKETVIGKNSPEYDGKPHGGYYTQDDLREIVAYAAKRHINVVPEIDMPGHMQAAIAAYPELGPGHKVEVFTKWGVNPLVLNTSDETVQFCKDVLAEIIEIFPSNFIHVGGDECPKTQWENDPREQERIKQRGLKDEHELQSWFIRQMDTFLVSKGRRLIGWDEILEGGLAPNATVMSWRGVEGGITASKMGHDVVMSPTSHMYLDYYQADPVGEPFAIGGFLPLEKVYEFNPVTPEIPADKAHHVLGVQGNLWTEYMKDFKHVEYMAFPRGCAVAEVGWTPQPDRNFEDFVNRLTPHLHRLRILDVNFRRLTPGR